MDISHSIDIEDIALAIHSLDPLERGKGCRLVSVTCRKNYSDRDNGMLQL